MMMRMRKMVMMMMMRMMRMRMMMTIDQMQVGTMMHRISIRGVRRNIGISVGVVFIVLLIAGFGCFTVGIELGGGGFQTEVGLFVGLVIVLCISN